MLMNRPEPVYRQFYSLGTVIGLKAFGDNGSKAIDKAVERLNEIDDKMSVFKGYSEISRINANAGKCPQQVSPDTYFVINKAVRYSEKSGGAFDPTIRPVIGSWGIRTDHEGIPGSEELKQKLGLVNYKGIVLDGNNCTVMLDHENMAIDLGAIAKGYAADEVKSIFLENSVESAIIDLGGNIFALGKKPDGMLWNIGVQHPFSLRGEYVGTLRVSDKSIVTSGDYERYFIMGGRKYHHIMDPSTGYPSDNGVISTTIISGCSIDGDALSTCAYVMGLEKGIEFIEAFEGADAIFITKDSKIYATSGIKGKFKLSNKEFIYEDYINRN